MSTYSEGCTMMYVQEGRDGRAVGGTVQTGVYKYLCPGGEWFTAQLRKDISSVHSL